MMTRAEFKRRAKEQNKSSKTYTLTAAQLNTVKKQAVQEAFKEIKAREDRRINDMAVEAYTLCIGLSLKVLHEKYGFGSKRLGDFAEAVNNEYYNSKMPLDELREYIFKKTGVKIITKE